MKRARTPSAKNRNVKATRHLPVLIEQDEDGVFIVSVPTLTGCRSYGFTLEEAMRNIAEAASLCLEDEPIPTGATFVGIFDLKVPA